MLTANIDVGRSIVAFRNEDGKTELTIFTTPLSTVEANSGHPPYPRLPGVSDETALKQTAENHHIATDSKQILFPFVPFERHFHLCIRGHTHHMVQIAR